MRAKSGYHFEWWNVVCKYDTGTCTLEIKARDEQGAITQIKKLQAYSLSDENMARSFWVRQQPIREVYWDTLRLDRVGHQR